MKVIDLLNKIAKGEEIPKKIKYKNKEYEYYERLNETFNYKDLVFNEYFSDEWFIENILNDEVEIIEEKDIEKIIINSQGNIEKKLIDGSTIVLPSNKDEILHIAYKINELIDIVKELRSKE